MKPTHLLLSVSILCSAFAAPSLAVPVPAMSEEQQKELLLKLNNLTTTDAMQAKLTELLKDKVTAKKLVTTAKAMQDASGKKESPFKFNALIIVGKLAQNVKDQKIAEEFYRASLEASKKLENSSQMALAFESLIDLLWDMKKFQAVEDLCTELIESPENGDEMIGAKNYALERMIQAKARRGEHEEALKVVDRLVAGNRNNWYPLQLKGYVLREAGKFEDAIEVYQDVLVKLEKDKRLKDEQKKRIMRNTKYLLTGIYVDNKDIEKATEILEKLIKEEPEVATYYNDLGFVMADNDMKIEESEKLIRKALELDKKAREKAFKEGKIDEETSKKENAAYLDSLGWVLYKNKKYEEAKKYLLESSKDDEEGAHMEIWDHLADVYLALGDTKLAVETWTKALKFEDISKRDAERRKKITEKLRKAKASLKKDQ